MQYQEESPYFKRIKTSFILTQTMGKLNIFYTQSLPTSNLRARLFIRLMLLFSRLYTYKGGETLGSLYF